MAAALWAIFGGLFGYLLASAGWARLDFLFGAVLREHMTPQHILTSFRLYCTCSHCFPLLPTRKPHWSPRFEMGASQASRLCGYSHTRVIHAASSCFDQPRWRYIWLALANDVGSVCRKLGSPKHHRCVGMGWQVQAAHCSTRSLQVQAQLRVHACMRVSPCLT